MIAFLTCRIFCFIYDVITNRNKLIINKLTSLLVAGPLPRMTGSVWVWAQFQIRLVHSLCRVYMEPEPVWLRYVLLWIRHSTVFPESFVYYVPWTEDRALGTWTSPAGESSLWPISVASAIWQAAADKKEISIFHTMQSLFFLVSLVDYCKVTKHE